MSFKKTAYCNVYERKKKNGKLVYYAKFTIDGKSYQRSLSAVNEKTAHKEYLALCKNIKNEDEGINLRNFFYDIYLPLIRPIQTLQTVRTKESYFKKHIEPVFGKSDFRFINYEQAQMFHNDMLKTHSPKTVKHIKDLLRVVTEKAIQMQFAEKNPFAYVQLPRFDNARYFQMSEEKIKTFMRTVRSFPEDLNRRIFMFLLHGRRLNEVLSLEWKDIDLENGTYEIPAQINKARRNMQYYMPDFLLDEIRLHAKEMKSFDGLVFPSTVTGRKIQDIRKAWRRILNAAGIEHMRIHDIRHMIGYYSINHLGISIEKVSHMLGHTDIKITQRYVNPRARSSKEVGEAIYASLS